MALNTTARKSWRDDDIWGNCALRKVTEEAEFGQAAGEGEKKIQDLRMGGAILAQ